MTIRVGYFTQLGDHCNGWKGAIGYNSVYQSFAAHEENSTGAIR